jgi:hypothetical protein
LRNLINIKFVSYLNNFYPSICFNNPVFVHNINQTTLIKWQFIDFDISLFWFSCEIWYISTQYFPTSQNNRLLISQISYVTIFFVIYHFITCHYLNQQMSINSLETMENKFYLNTLFFTQKLDSSLIIEKIYWFDICCTA